MANADVNKPGLAYEEMASEGWWDLLGRLTKGTKAMRDARKDYLPMFPQEEPTEYEARLNSTFLYPMFADTVEKFVAKPFSRMVEFPVEPPEALAVLTQDMDRTGTTPTQFARAWFQDALTYGLGHALVDFSMIPEVADGETLLRGEEQDRGARPTALRITPPNLIDWDFSTLDGEQVLSEIRFRRTRTERNGFEQEPRKQVVHYKSDSIDFWEEVEKDQWEIVDNATHSFGRVPLVTWYTMRTGPMTAKPPLLGLAEVNLDHWITFSDYKNLEHIVSVAVFFTKGFASGKEEKGTKEIGPKRKLTSRNENADAKWVEHTGKGIETLEKGLKRREERAEALGHEATSREKSPITATGEVRDVQKANSNLQAWVFAEKEALRQVFELAGDWTSAELPEDFQADIYTDFSIGAEKDKQIDQLQKDADAGRITTKTYLKEGKRRKLFSEDLDIDEEVEMANQEAMDRAQAALALVPEDPPDDDGQEVA